MDERPARHFSMMEIASVISRRSTCGRRQVGCVLVDAHGRVLSMGHNGAPRGEPHCVDRPCPGRDAATGQGLELCEATHAEANALLFCPDVMKIHTCYATTAPCLHCVKLLMNTSCETIIYLDDYTQRPQAQELWCRLNSWKLQNGQPQRRFAQLEIAL